MELPYGRLPIMNGDELVGQVSRRDVLHHAGVLACILRHGHDRSAQPVESSASPDAPSTSWLQFPDTLSNYTVMDYADDNSQTISADMNLFSIARLFLVSSFRRFPVLRDGRLIGQISRCDLLREVLALTC
jgi:CBS domain-containing protein